MKKILLFAIAMTVSICHFAQEGQLWWGYYDESDPNGHRIGYGGKCTTDAAIYIPRNHTILGNDIIKAVRIWLGDDIDKIDGDLTIWIHKFNTNDLPSNFDISYADYIQVVPKSSLMQGLNEFALTTPYRVNNAGIYVGFTFSTNCSSSFIMSSGKGFLKNSFFLRTNGFWENYSEECGNLAIQIQLDGGSLGANSASPSDFETLFVEKGSSNSVSVPLNIINYGKEPITSVSYTLTKNGVEIIEKTVNVDTLLFNHSVEISIPFPIDNEAKKNEMVLKIAKVNGKENEASQKTAKGALIVILEKPVVVPVVEEFTSTGCGWCPIGIDGMDHVHEVYGDKVALISIHGDDPMKTVDYASVPTLGGYPSSYVNRAKGPYPNGSSLRRYIDEQMKRVTGASLQVLATWANEEKTEIIIDTKTKFVYSEENGKYGLAFVITEDEMTGSGPGWIQYNSLSGNSSYAYSYPFWYNSPYRIMGQKYNYVAVAAWGIDKGVDGSVRPTIVAGEEQKYFFNAKIAGNTLIQDKTKLKVIVLLIDKVTGLIMNAALTSIREYDDTSISNTHITDAHISARYTIDGRKTTIPQKGLNIIKKSDGTIIKIIVK
ncbi:MAG: hypothetical protein J5720_06155 [Bacteroidaceae bacterium]|nr:hypothetical protein [Bacteroidaceae bacterium]